MYRDTQYITGVARAVQGWIAGEEARAASAALAGGSLAVGGFASIGALAQATPDAFQDGYSLTLTYDGGNVRAYQVVGLTLDAASVQTAPDGMGGFLLSLGPIPFDFFPYLSRPTMVPFAAPGPQDLTLPVTIAWQVPGTLTIPPATPYVQCLDIPPMTIITVQQDPGAAWAAMTAREYVIGLYADKSNTLTPPEMVAAACGEADADVSYCWQGVLPGVVSTLRRRPWQA